MFNGHYLGRLANPNSGFVTKQLLYLVEGTGYLSLGDAVRRCGYVRFIRSLAYTYINRTTGQKKKPTNQTILGSPEPDIKP